jgi:hypothetical protein
MEVLKHDFSTNPLVKRGTKDKHLLNWLKDQRERYQQGKLTDERIVLLEKLPNWNWQPSDNFWTLIYEDFREWAKTHNLNNIPKDLTFAGANARSWVQNQRSRYRKNGLEFDRVKLLESTPGWMWKVKDDRWMQNYINLKNLSNDSSKINHSTEPQLIEWINTQRKSKRARRLDPTRIKLLESLPNWSWTSQKYSEISNTTGKPITKKWMSSYTSLRRYVDSFGDARIPVNFLYDKKNLGKWVSHQRGNYKNGTLDQFQISLLEQLNGWSWRIK